MKRNFSGSSGVQLCAQTLTELRVMGGADPLVNIQLWIAGAQCVTLQGRKCESVLNSARISSLKDHHFHGGAVSLSGKAVFLFCSTGDMCSSGLGCLKHGALPWCEYITPLLKSTIRKEQALGMALKLYRRV